MSENLIRIFRDHYYIPLYFLTWVISVIRYRRYFDTPLKFFPILIIYTFFTELLGYFIKYNDEFQFFSDARYSWHNVVIFNIYQLVFFLFFFEVYRKLFDDQQMKPWWCHAWIFRSCWMDTNSFCEYHALSVSKFHHVSESEWNFNEISELLNRDLRFH